MKIFPVEQIAGIDKFTVENEPILSVNLMERAVGALYDELACRYDEGQRFIVFAGPGNNGGDALALSRIMLLDGFEVVTVLLRSNNLSNDAEINLDRLSHIRSSALVYLDRGQQLPVITPGDVIVDGLFGSGLNRPLKGEAADVVAFINRSEVEVVSIDIPSGLMGEDNSGNCPYAIVKADFTYTFELPKLAFMFPENECYAGVWKVVPIGLYPSKIESTPTNWFYTLVNDCSRLIPKRRKFTHKGDMGHLLLIAGSYGKIGAAVLAGKASLRSGVGLLTVHLPHNGGLNFHAALPEAMVNIDRSDLMFTEHPSLDNFSVVAVGPGIGTRVNCTKALRTLIFDVKEKRLPFVLDADAINILAAEKNLLSELPPNTIITPHPGEFKRLAGEWSSDYERMNKAVDMAVKYSIIIVLKGAYTMVVTPDGNCYFNSTGNPGMATGGSGDALTGVIASLLGRGVKACDAAVAGVYLHGLAGDIAKKERGEDALMASDLIDKLGDAFKKVLDY
ncbi:NAD(P)H-hydrate dehydratase [Marinilabiliaceae bacterium ANBcel2]|nr:NAD(P)H-hydrate dehydratase [Marinilabiliaceae bacterium ANBcel2]